MMKPFNMTTVRALTLAALVVASFGVAVAKLPAPPPLTDEQKAAAEEKKAKDVVAAEAAKAAQARAEDRVAARYIAEQKAKGKTIVPQMGPTSTAVASPMMVKVGAPVPAAAAKAAGPASVPAPAKK